MIKLLCLDIDGTILNSRKELTEGIKNAVDYAKGQGVKVFLASGRSLPGLKDILEELDITGNCICMSGAPILAGGKEIERNGLDGKHLDILVDCAQKYDSQLFLTGMDFNLTNRELLGHLADEVGKGSLRGDYIIRTDWRSFRDEVARYRAQVLKAAMKQTEEDNFRKMKEELLSLGLFHVVKSDTNFVDINPVGCNKGKAVETLARYYGFGMENVMCIGDDENDVEMVGRAGYGVAMGNAEECVRKVARYVTESNDEDGAAKAVFRLIGKGE